MAPQKSIKTSGSRLKISRTTEIMQADTASAEK